jgi:predicted nucleotidyltransferase
MPEVHRIILFGSRAGGDADERSDIDLAIEAPQASQKRWLQLLLLLDDLDTLLSLDVIRLEDASALLRERVMEEGKVLYERS